MKTTRLSKKTLPLAFLLVAGTSSLSAAVYTWSHGANGNWTGANWTVGSTAAQTWVAGNSAAFDGASGYNVTVDAVVDQTGITVNGAGNWTFTSTAAIGGTGGLVKNGTGTLTLSGANTYTGGTTISGGTLVVTNTGALGTGGTTGTVINAGGQLNIDVAYSSSGHGKIQIAGGTLGIKGGTTFTGNIGSSIEFAGTGSKLESYGTGIVTITLANDVNSIGINVLTGTTNAQIGENILLKSTQYGMRIDVNGTGDLTVKGNISALGAATAANSGVAVSFWKRGTGNLTLTGVATLQEGLSLQNGTMTLSGADDRLTATVLDKLIINTGGTDNNSGVLVLNGISQTVGGIRVVGTGTGNAIVGGSTTMGTLVVSSDAVSSTYTGKIGGAGTNQNNIALTKSGTSILTLSAANTYAGATTITGGTLKLDAAGSIAESSKVNLTTAGTVFDITTATGNQSIKSLAGIAGTTVNIGANALSLTAAADTFSGVITGTGGLAVTGTAVLTGANTYAGGTTINTGTLSLGSGAAGSATGLGAGSITVNSGGILKLWVNSAATATTIANNLTVNGGTIYSEDGNYNMTGTVSVGATGATFGTKYNNKNLTFSNTISGTGNVTTGSAPGGGGDGGGKITFAADSTYAGTTTIAAKVLQIGTGGTTGTLGSGAVINNGTLIFNRSNNYTVNNSISGTGAVTINNTAAGATTILTGTNTYAGATTITAGTLQLGDGTAAGALAATTIVTVNTGATLVLKGGATGATYSIAGIAGAGTISKTSTADVSFSAAAGTFSGKILSTSTGLLTLGNITQAESIDIGAGGLKIGATGSGAFTLTGATQSSNAAGTIDANLTINSGHTLKVSPGSASTLTITSGLTLHDTTLEFDHNSGVFDLIDITAGTLTLTGTMTLKINNLGGTIDSGNYEIIREQTGSTIPADVANFIVPIINADTRGIVVAGTGAHANSAYLSIVKKGADLVWNGNSTDWNTDTGNLAWNTTVVAFSNDDAVTFNDTLTGANRSINITTDVAPFDIVVDTAGTYTLTNAGGKITGTAGLTKQGTGTLTLNGATNDFTGTVTILGGTLELTGTGPLFGGNRIAGTLGAGSTAAGSLVINGGTLKINGTGTTTTDRAFTVGTNSASLESAAGNLVEFTSTAPIANTATGDNKITLTGAGDGSIALAFIDPVTAGKKLSVEKTGTGTWTLQGANTFTGDVIVTAGTLGVNAAAIAGTTNINLAGGTLTNATTTTTIADTSADLTISATKAITANGGAINAHTGTTITVDGALNGTGNLTKTGDGTVILAGTSGNFSGILTVSTGALQVDKSAALGAAANVAVNAGAFLDINTAALSLNTLTGTGTAQNITSAAATLSLGANNGTAVVDTLLSAGTAGGTLAFVKLGTGQITLNNAANTFSGAITVSGGTLKIGAAGAIGSNGAITVEDGATLDLGGQQITTAKAVITGTGYNAAGALTNTIAGGSIELIELTGNSAIGTAVDTAITTVTGTGDLTLVSHPDALAGAPNFILSGTDATIENTGDLIIAAKLSTDGVQAGSINPSGEITITATGELVSNITDIINPARTITLGGKLTLIDGVSQTLAGITGSGSIASSGGSNGTLILDAQTPLVLDAKIGGANALEDNISLIKTGNETLELTNADSTYTGITTVTAGTLKLAGNLGEGGTAGILGDDSNTDANRLLLNGATLLSETAGTSKTLRSFTVGANGATLASNTGALQFAGTGPVAFASDVTDVTLFLTGTSTDDNTLALDLANPAGGTLALKKTGTGRWILTGGNTYTGTTSVENGTLALGKNNAISITSPVVIGLDTNDTKIDLNGFKQTLTLADSSTRGTGQHIIYNSKIAASAASTLTINGAADQTTSIAIGTGGTNINLVKTGAGKLTLSGTLTYTGDTTIEQGTLAIKNSVRPASKKITVYSGAQLDVTGLTGGLKLSAGQTLIAGSNDTGKIDLVGNYILTGGMLQIGENPVTNIGRNLTVNGNVTVSAASDFRFFLTDSVSAASNSTVKLSTLNLNAVANLNPVLVNGALALGTYTLFTYGTLAGDVGNLKFNATIDPRYTFSITNNSPRNQIILTIDSATAEAPLIWVGDTAAGEWSSTADNFKKQGTDERDAFFPGDYATFDNSAANFNAVVGTGGVSIGAITVNNDTAHNYTFSGGEIRGDGYIEKLGTGTLTLTGTNNYLGKLDLDGNRTAATILSQGTIAVGNDKALGAGTLLVYGSDTTPTTLASIGDFTIANRIELTTGTHTTFDSGAGALGVSGQLIGDKDTIIKKTGTGALRFANTSGKADFQGTIQHTAGSIELTAAVNHSKATYELNADNVSLVAAFTGADAAQIGAFSGSASTTKVTADGTGTLTLEVGALNTDTAYAGSISDGTAQLAFRKVGTGTLTLTGTADNTGGIEVGKFNTADNTYVKGGVLQIGNGGTTGNITAGTATINLDSTLAYNRSDSLTLAITLDGNGTFEQRGTGVLTIANDNTDLEGTVLVSAGTLRIIDTGNIGTASVENNATVEINNNSDKILANELNGSGTYLKTGSGTLALTGNKFGTGNTNIKEGKLVIGNDASDAVQDFYGQEIKLNDTPLELQGRVNLVANITGAGLVTQTGTQLVILAGNITGTDKLKLNIDAGTFQVGNSDNLGNIQGGVLTAIGQDGTLAFNRNGTLTHDGIITGSGTLNQLGGTQKTGTLILTARNTLTGSVSVSNASTLQIGDAAHTTAALCNPADTVNVNVAQAATLRFNTVGNTGANLNLAGNGTIEKSGEGTLVFDSNTGAFTGKFLATSGTLAFETNNLPATATAGIQARDTGTIEVRNGTGNMLALDNRFSGNGIFALTANANVPADSYAKFGYTRTATDSLGIINVGARANFNLGETSVEENSVRAKQVNILPGGLLSGNGRIAGNLENKVDGTIAPGNSIGTVYVDGNYINSGTVKIEIASATSYDRIVYQGSAVINAGSTVNFYETTAGVFDQLFAEKALIEFLIDGDPGNNPSGASITGNFTNGNYVGNTITFSTGDGLALLFSTSIADIPGVSSGLHNGLDDYVNYLNQTIVANDSPETASLIAQMLAPGDGITPAKALNQASPIGLASMTAMAITAAHDNADKTRQHLESLRYERSEFGRNFDAVPYFTVTGVFADSDKGRKTPAFNFNTYGGLAGLDHSFGTQCIAGIAGGYHGGTATIHDNGGKVKQSSGTLSAYGTYMVTDFIYVDASVYGGYDSYEVQHDTIFGRATAKPDGFNVGGNAYLGGILPVTKEFHFTPYAGFDYTYAAVNGFNEKGSDAALKVDSFNQDSLRAKIGTGINWVAPVGNEYFLRLALNVAYAYDVLDNETDITAHFANDNTGRKFTANAISTPEQSIQVGPTIEFRFDENKTINLNYTFEYDFESQYIHHLNAEFRMRF